MKTMSKEEFKNFQPSNGLKKAAELVFAAMAVEQTLKAEVKTIQESILSKHCFPYSKRLSKYKNCGPVLNADHTYLLAEYDADIYYNELFDAYKKKGFDVERGACPALIAECTSIDAKKILVKEAEYITNITYDQLFCTATAYDRYIDLLLKLCAPFVNKHVIKGWLNN